MAMDGSIARTQWWSQLHQNYTFLSTSVLVFYDYFLTLPDEIAIIWSGNITFTKALFYCNRYPYLFFQLLNLIRSLWHFGDVICGPITHLANASVLLPAISITTIFTLRTFAIYQKSYAVLMILGSLGLGLVATNIWGTIAIDSVPVPSSDSEGPFICMEIVPQENNRWVMANFIITIVFDSLVFVLTVLRTIKLAVQIKKFHMANSLTYLFLRDGIIYYVIFFALTLTPIALAAVSQTSEEGVGRYILADFTNMANSIQWLIVNRMVLNKCQVYNGSSSSSSSFRTRTGLSEPVFATNPFLGNIGAPFRVEDDEVDEHCELSPGCSSRLDEESCG